MKRKISSKLYNYLNNDFYGFLGFLFWGIFFFHSIIFYQECIAYQDYAWEVKYFLNKEGFNLVYFRWGSLPWRIFLIIGPYLNLGLKTILLLTSIWFVLLKFGAWYVCHFKFKNTFAGLLVISTVIFSHSKGYYAHGWQIHNALFYFALLFAIVTDQNKLIKSHVVKIILVSTLLILIKGTYAVILLICPLLIFFSIDNLKNKAWFILSFSVFLIISMMFFNPPYETNIMNSMLHVLKYKTLNDLSGIIFYFFTELVSMYFLIPLIFFFATSYLLIKNKSYFSFILFALNAIVLFIIIVFKLGTYKSNYPLSHSVDFYMEGAFFILWMFIISISFYWLNYFYPDVLKDNVSKTVVVFIIIFYTSGIFKEGIKHWEYNQYMQTLTIELQNTFEERIFIIDENHIPQRFSKLNMNVEYETLIKNNLYLCESLILYVTAHTESYTINDEFPVFLNSITPIETTRKVNFDPDLDLSRMRNTSENQELNHYKQFNPTTYFSNYNENYFKFSNFKYKVLEKDFMSNFNKQYGFAISDYYY
jgi:hypothetical protein